MTTMRDDALSILGDEELVTELESKTEESRKKKKEMRGPGAEVAAGAVVIKSEDEAEEPSQPVEEPSEEPEVESVPVVMKIFGGATSMAEAEGWLKQQDKMYEILDSFNMLQGVMENVIMDSEVKDKPAAIKSLIAEFKDRVDEAVKRSLAIRAAQTILNKEGGDMSEQEKPQTEVTPAPTPLEAAFAKLSAAVESAKADNTSPVEDRYKAVQPALNAFAEVLKAEVRGPQAQGEEMAAAVARAVAEQLKPISDALGVIASRSSAAPTPTVPQPRSFQPGSVTDQPSGPQSPLSKMIRRSVGLRE